MDRGKGTGAWALLGLAGAGGGGSLGAWEDAARSNDNDLAVGEFLLKFPGEAVTGMLASIPILEVT